jgi:uncharacterized protein (TIGR00725 family)
MMVADVSNPIVAVFGSSQTKPSDPAYGEATRLGRLLGEMGFDVANGGYGGAMEAVSSGAGAAGARVVGVTAPALFPSRGGGNRHLTEESHAATIGERIATLVNMADATISLPGSLGTAAELIVAWNDNFVAGQSGGRHRPQIAVGPDWEALIGLLATRVQADRSLVICVEDVDQAANRLGAIFSGRRENRA